MTEAFHIRGGDGRQILVQVPGDPDPAAGKLREGRNAEAIAKTFEEYYASEVQKRVRSRAVSLVSAMDRERGKQKPTPVGYETLRLLSQRNEWARAIINTRKRQVAGVKWSIGLKDTDDPTGASAEAARVLTKLLKHPCLGGSRPQSMHWQQWLGMWLEDLLVFDRGCIEKEWNKKSWPVALYPVDGSTIRPNMDEQGGFYRDAYIQVVDGQKTAEFGMEDLIVAMYNPTTDVKLAGYGYSPLEALVVSVTADLHAAKFNADYFQKGSIPEGILSLGQDVDPEHVDAFRQYWMSEITGKAWTLPIIGGSENPEFIDWRQSNRDMQFMEYQDWLLQKMCAVFEMDKTELGSIEDVNRSTAETTDSQQQRKGITPLLEFIANTINLEIVGEHGAGLGDFLEFSFDEVGESADEINNKFAPLVAAGAANREEWRDAHGLEAAKDGTVGAEGHAMYLSDGQPQPLPSSKDVAVMGAAATLQQQQEAQQQDMEHQNLQADKQAAADDGGGAGGAGGEKAGMPWKPADGDHPDVKAAMADHDREQGIGPRNVGKTHPGGHDRHPALTGNVQDLDDVFASATDRLLEGLSTLVGA